MAGSITSGQESASRSDRGSQSHFCPALFEMPGFFMRALFLKKFGLNTFFVLEKTLSKVVFESKPLQEDQKYFSGHQPYRFFDWDPAEFAPFQCVGIHQRCKCGVAVCVLTHAHQELLSYGINQ